MYLPGVRYHRRGDDAEKSPFADVSIVTVHTVPHARQEPSKKVGCWLGEIFVLGKQTLCTVAAG